MDYEKIAKEISKHSGWYATTYTQDEVVKIITEPITHIAISNMNTYDEFDIKKVKGEWVVTCETASMNVLCELRDMLDEIGVL